MKRLLEPHEMPENAVLLDARPEAAYREGHILGARPVDLATPKFGIRGEADLERFHEALRAAASAAGLEEGRPVVVYDGGPETRAARTAWALEYAGLTVGVLRGGVGAWAAAGRPLTPEPSRWEPTRFTVRPRPELLATADELRTRLDSGEPLTLIDARSGPEYRGETAPPGTPRRGRIPGARRLEWTRTMNEAGYKPDDEIAAELAGVPEGSEVVVYCQSGARSAVLYHALRSRGYRVRNYVGSAGEWLGSPELPVEAGEGREL